MAIVAAQELDTSRPRVVLDGRWEFSYDPGRVGEARGWSAEGARLPERINVPGCSQARRFRSAGAAAGQWEGLPEVRAGTCLRHACFHDSWYRRRFRIPASWRGRRVWLHVGGVSPAAAFWINGRRLGRTLTSRCPVRADLTRHVRFGASNLLAVKVEWSERALNGVFDALTAWSGLYRSVWVEAVPEERLDGVHVATSIDPPGATFRVALTGGRRAAGRLRLLCEVKGTTGARIWSGEAAAAGSEACVGIEMPGARPWSPQEPNLYTAALRLCREDEALDTAAVRFGLRELRTEGFRVLLNGRPVFLRGGCDDQLYPQTVCPPADKAFIAARLRAAKRYGINYTNSCV